MAIFKGVYGITPPQFPCTAQSLDTIEKALQGGLSVLQYRNKSPQRDYAINSQELQHVLALQDLCRQYHCLFVINDNAVLAHQIKADGLHLGQQDIALHQARDLLGPSIQIGITCHNAIALAQQAEKQGADYVAFGSFFPSQTKPNASKAEISTLTQAKQSLGLPIVAIGGITLENAPALISAGADMIAVVQSLFDGPCIRTQSQQLTDLFSTSRDRKSP